MDEKVKHECTPQTCSYHLLTENIIKDMKSAVDKLIEGQDSMRETVIHLTDAFKTMDRIESRLEKLEELQRETDKEQDQKIQELRGFMYKLMGVAAGAGAVMGVLLKFIGLG